MSVAASKQRTHGKAVRKSSPERAARGRPREFDADEALGRALDVFWRRGYEGASLQELTRAMGVNRPSLYAAFGNKEALFRKALDRYQGVFAALGPNPFDAPTAREAVATLLHRVADFLGDKTQPPGCLITQTALSCGEESEAIRQELNARRASTFVHVRKRLQRAKREGELPADCDLTALARYVSVIVLGMGVQAACGASRRDLVNIVEIALRAWPSAGITEQPKTNISGESSSCP